VIVVVVAVVVVVDVVMFVAVVPETSRLSSAVFIAVVSPEALLVTALRSWGWPAGIDGTGE
jgi:hypothetical protein